jgi:hypothetical protein
MRTIGNPGKIAVNKRKSVYIILTRPLVLA